MSKIFSAPRINNPNKLRFLPKDNSSIASLYPKTQTGEKIVIDDGDSDDLPKKVVSTVNLQNIGDEVVVDPNYIEEFLKKFGSYPPEAQNTPSQFVQETYQDKEEDDSSGTDRKERERVIPYNYDEKEDKENKEEKKDKKISKNKDKKSLPQMYDAHKQYLDQIREQANTDLEFYENSANQLSDYMKSASDAIRGLASKNMEIPLAMGEAREKYYNLWMKALTEIINNTFRRMGDIAKGFKWTPS